MLGWVGCGPWVILRLQCLASSTVEEQAVAALLPPKVQGEFQGKFRGESRLGFPGEFYSERWMEEAQAADQARLVA